MTKTVENFIKKQKSFLEQPNDVIKDSLRMQMENVKSYHTYLNRVDDILKVFEIKRAFESN